MNSPSCDVGDLGVAVESANVGSCSGISDSQPDIESCVHSQVMAVEHLLGDVDTKSMDISDDLLDDARSCTEYDIPCQVSTDDSEEVLYGSQD